MNNSSNSSNVNNSLDSKNVNKLITNLNFQDMQFYSLPTYKIIYNNNLGIKSTKPSENDKTRSLILVPKLRADSFFIEDTQFGKTINKLNTRFYLNVRYINSKYYLYLSKNINNTSYWELNNGEFKNKVHDKMYVIPSVFLSLSKTKDDNWNFIQS